MDYGFNEWAYDSEGGPASNTTAEDGKIGFDGRNVIGFDSSLREIIFKSIGIDYDLHVLETYELVISGVAAKDCDVGFAPITLTSIREGCNCPGCRCVDFSHPYFPGSVGYMYKKGTVVAQVSTISALLSPSVVNIVNLFVFLVIITGHIIWYLESRGHNAQFPMSYRDGVTEGIWWSAVTATTVGYGDKVPISRNGKAFAFVWMIMGVIFFAILSGELSASLVRPSLDATSYAHFRGVRSCIHQPYVDQFLKPNGISCGDSDIACSVGVFSECVESFENGEVEAIFYDIPIMQAMAVSGRFKGFSFSDVGFASLDMADFAVAFPEAESYSDLELSPSRFNYHLRNFLADKANRNVLMDRFFGPVQAIQERDLDEFNWTLGGVTTGCILWFILLHFLGHRNDYKKELLRVTKHREAKDFLRVADPNKNAMELLRVAKSARDTLSKVAFDEEDQRPPEPVEPPPDPVEIGELEASLRHFESSAQLGATSSTSDRAAALRSRRSFTAGGKRRTNPNTQASILAGQVAEQWEHKSGSNSGVPGADTQGIHCATLDQLHAVISEHLNQLSAQNANNMQRMEQRMEQRIDGEQATVIDKDMSAVVSPVTRAFLEIDTRVRPPKPCDPFSEIDAEFVC
jgi:hypothetical protein